MEVKVIGITGGISSGKSTVARMLASFGAAYIDADEMCHRLYLKNDIKKKIVEEFGDDVLNDTAGIDRKQLAKIVFQDKGRLDILCNILHPIVIERIHSKIAEIEKQGRKKAIVIDAALLEESDISVICDYVIFINTTKAHRQERSRVSRHWEENELEKREAFQMALGDKKKRADYIIDNNTSVDNTFQQVKKIWQLYIEDINL